MGELLLLTAIAWAAARGIESTIDGVKGRTTTRHKAAVAKVAAQGGEDGGTAGAGKSGGKGRGEAPPSGAPATFGRKAAHLTARSVAGGATWGRDAVAAYREALADAYRTEAEKARARRAAKAAKKDGQDAAAGPAPATGTPPAGPLVPPPPPYPPTAGAPAADNGQYDQDDADDSTPAVPHLRVLPGGADPDPDPAGSLMTILDTAEIDTLGTLIRYLRAVSTVSEVNADTARLIADQDAKLAARLDAITAQLAGLDVDADTVGEVARLRELVEAQASAARQCGEQSVAAAEAAVVAAAGAHIRHGAIAAAVADSDVAAPADAAYYTEGK